MSINKENQRDSSDEDRKLEGGVLRQDAVPPPAPPSSGVHPAVYIAIWIACSSGVIIFNKWVLATAKFSKSRLYSLETRSRVSPCSPLPAVNQSLTIRLVASYRLS